MSKIYYIALIVIFFSFYSITEGYVSLNEDEYKYSNEFRNEILSLLWNNKIGHLRIYCENHPKETKVFINEMLDKISLNNKNNNAYYFIAKNIIMSNHKLYENELHRLVNASRFVENQFAEKEVLVPFINIDILEFNDFLYVVEAIIQIYDFKGLSELVKQNPNNTKKYIIHVVDKLSIDSIDVNSHYYNFICKMGLLYRNHFHSSELLDAINNKLGGVGKFLEKEIQKEGISVLPGNKYTEAAYFMNKMNEIRINLINLKYEMAVKQLKKEIMVSKYIFSNTYLLPGTSNGWYPDLILFYALIEFRFENFKEGNLALTKCLNRGDETYFYAAFLIGSDEKIEKHKELIDKAFLSYSDEKTLVSQRLIE